MEDSILLYIMLVNSLTAYNFAVAKILSEIKKVTVRIGPLSVTFKFKK